MRFQEESIDSAIPEGERNRCRESAANEKLLERFPLGRSNSVAAVACVASGKVGDLAAIRQFWGKTWAVQIRKKKH